MFALNPADRLLEAAEVRVLSNSKDIEKALNSYIVDNTGNLPTAFNTLEYGYYDICKTTVSGCVSLGELIPNYLPSLPEDTRYSTADTTGFKIKYDPAKKEVMVDTYSEYRQWAEVNGETLTEGLVGYWKMDETSGNAVDSSGNNNIGTWYGSGTHYPVGRFGNGGGFNVSNNDYIEITDSTNSVFDFRTNGFTLSVWIKTSIGITADWVGILSKYSNNKNFWIQLDPSSNKYVGCGWDGSTYMVSTKSVNDGNWHHIVCQRSGLTSGLIIVDGVQVYSSASQPNNDLNDNNSLRIGSLMSSIPRYFTGVIDEVRIFNRILKSTEITALYNHAPSPIAQWKFNEGVGTIAQSSIQETSATGGTVSDVVGYKIHTFTSSGTFTSLENKTVEALIVAGGGGGGWGNTNEGGGGGGAGGLLYNPAYSITNQAYTITVGAGGSVPTSSGTGGTGGNSVFSSNTAIGGGGGGGCGSPVGVSGGSGGGGQGCGTDHVGGSATQGSSGGFTGYGTSGGLGAWVGYSPGYGNGGGGGGAGGAGVSGHSRTVDTIGGGGAGLSNNISGTGVTYASGGNGGPGRSSYPGAAAVSNLGNGSVGGNIGGGAGGSGIVVIRYPKNNNGTLTNGPIWIDGKFNKAINFNGSTAFLDVGNNPSINLTNNFTVEAWVNTTMDCSTGAQAGGIISWGEQSSGKRRSLLIWSGGSGSNCYLYFSGFGSSANISSNTLVNDGMWHHVSASIDSSNYAKIYIDGVLKNQGSLILGSYVYSGTNIGRTQYPEYYKGLIDDVRIYNYVRTQEQIMKDMNNL